MFRRPLRDLVKDVWPAGTPSGTIRCIAVKATDIHRLLATAACATAFACGGATAVTAQPSTPTEPYIVVLGTAQDAGLPQIGSDSAGSSRARRDPRFARLVTSLLVVDPVSKQRWLIDCTPDIRRQVEIARLHPTSRATDGPRPALFDGIFLTHAHIGHYAGLMQLGREAYAAKGVPVYGSKSMTEFLSENGPWNLLVKLGNIKLQTLEPGASVTLTSSLSVTAITVPHRAEYTDTVGFVIRGPSRAVLYIPDIDKWERWDTAIEDVVSSVDIALLDGTFYADGEIPGRSMADIPHPFISESLGRFAKLPARERQKILFTHLNHTNPAADPNSKAANAIRAAGMGVASDGQIVRLGPGSP